MSAVAGAGGVVDGFVSVSAGWGYACGLRASGVLRCWLLGDMVEHNDLEKEEWAVGGWSAADEPPGGAFRQVAAGRGFACGLRPGGAAECWGRNPIFEAPPPGGVFKSLSAALEYVCGVRPSGEVECWGNPRVRRWVHRYPTDSPPGVFTDIATGRDSTCGLRPGGEVECWGGDYNQGVEPPAGPFERLEEFAYVVCGITVGGEAVCWVDPRGVEADSGALEWPDRVPPLPRPDIRLRRFGTTGVTCGIDYDYAAVCWRAVEGGFEFLPTPGGEFTSVTGESRTKCAVRRDDGGVECWNRLNGEARPAPEGEFSDIWLLGGRGCGVRPGGELDCWWLGAGLPPPPDGRFKAVSVSDSFWVCGVRVDGGVDCWPDLSNRAGAEWSPPEGEFTKVSVSRRHACGLRPDGGIECWGGVYPAHGKLDTPEGEFASVSAGWEKRGRRPGPIFGPGREDGRVDYITYWAGYTCGLLIDGSARCWGVASNIKATEYHTWEHVREKHPVVITPEGAFTQIGAGREFACGLRADTRVACWGTVYPFPWGPIRAETEDGSLGPYIWEGRVSYLYGDPITGPEAEHRALAAPDYPDPLRGGEAPTEGFTQISVGRRDVCGLLAGGGAECWRANRSTTYSMEGPYTQLSVAYDLYVCGVRGDGGVDCWRHGSGPPQHIPAPITHPLPRNQ